MDRRSGRVQRSDKREGRGQRRPRIAAAGSPAAADETFNITNGDVFVWENVWPAIADALGMKPGDAVPLSLAQQYPTWIAPWDELRNECHDKVRFEVDR